jgi:hypothetical protein
MPRKGAQLPPELARSIRRQARRAERAREIYEREQGQLKQLLTRAHVEEGWPLEAVGDAAGLTRQRVSQIVIKARAAGV